MRKFKTFIVSIIVVLFFGLFSVFSATSNVEPNVGISPNEDYYKEENFNRNDSNGSGFNKDDILTGIVLMQILTQMRQSQQIIVWMEFVA